MYACRFMAPVVIWYQMDPLSQSFMVSLLMGYHMSGTISLTIQHYFPIEKTRGVAIYWVLGLLGFFRYWVLGIGFLAPNAQYRKTWEIFGKKGRKVLPKALFFERKLILALILLVNSPIAQNSVQIVSLSELQFRYQHKRT